MTDPKNSRRDFLKTSALAAGVAGTASLGTIPSVFAAGDETIKVGLIGCGGRGTGAAENICEAAGSTYNVKLHAMGDVFENRLDGSFDRLKRNEKVGDKFDVSEDRKFVGFDAYKKVTDCCDLVLLATPPGFRPQHIEYAVEQGKHIFAEKPVAVDSAGVRKILASYEQAKSKGLGIVAGTQRRHQAPYIDSLNRILDGAIGDVVSARVFWNQGNIWAHPRQPGEDDMHYQVRNWYHFLWLCGDHIVEQHIHNMDVARWALGDVNPVRCVATGSQFVNTGPEFGESYDNFYVDYEFPDNVHVHSMCRQINGCANNVSETIVGTKGQWTSQGYRFSGQARERVRGEGVPAMVQEHIDLLESIANGEPLNELKRVAESTLMAIMGRTSAYTGKEVSWEDILTSELDTFPESLEWGPRPDLILPKPGITELI
ncbi:Gfo/Idh/MocA family oxidoreductase [soil metagenome]